MPAAGALGDADSVGDVADARLRVVSDEAQHPAVVGQKGPGGIAFSRFLDAHEILRRNEAPASRHLNSL